MRKLNLKNKVFIVIFVLIIIGIIGLLVYAMSLSKNKSDDVYTVTSNTVLFASDTSKIDTSTGGKIEKRWDDKYYYLSNDDNSYDLGIYPVVFDKSTEVINIYGEKYQIQNNGSITNIVGETKVTSSNFPYFYKLDDRLYLIVANEISTEDKGIYATKYLVVQIDKQGNASLYNDVLNIKTINPVILKFQDYTFDIANEKLIIGDKTVDLKTIIGSTNEYEYIEKKTVTNVDNQELLESYNKLIDDFNQYTRNNNLLIAAKNQVSQNNIVINKVEQATKAAEKANRTNISKRVSLRGAISYPSYVDITYVVTDPENKYQVVYLLVTGNINGTMTTEKIILDKNDTTVRIQNLVPNNEYSVSLGYIEVVTDEDTEKKSLFDYIEDVINVRTTKLEYIFKINKISSGNVSFTFKMDEIYAFKSAKISLYVDGQKTESIDIDYNQMISENGFTSKLPLDYGFLYELRVEEAIYNGKPYTDTIISKKFTVN